LNVQLINKSIPSNSDVRPCATRKWSIDPDDFSTLNVNSNLMSKSWTIAFMAEPSWIERLRFLDATIYAINSDLAS
jgi:hypothetical protein